MQYRLNCIRPESSAEAVELLREIGTDPYGIEAMAPKMQYLCILVEAVECKIANIIKQEMLSLGADAAVARGTVDCSVSRTDVILMGTRKQVERFAEKIASQPFGLAEVAATLKRLMANLALDSWMLTTCRRTMRLGSRVQVMGIVNATPDSFSDAGLFVSTEAAVQGALRMVEQGADIIDVGGESTRPGSEPVSHEEELARVIPVIERLASQIGVPISIDTYKPEIAEQALQAGASIVNDVTGLADERMVKLVAEKSVSIIIMHMKGLPKTMQENPTYEDLMGEISQFFSERAAKALAAGLGYDKIMVDPGIGFGKTLEHNLEIMYRLSEFKSLGYPIVLGPSRKSFIGLALGGLPVDERLEGTAASVAYGIAQGANVVRVHDVKEMVRVAKMTDAILSSALP